MSNVSSMAPYSIHDWGYFCLTFSKEFFFFCCFIADQLKLINPNHKRPFTFVFFLCHNFSLFWIDWTAFYTFRWTTETRNEYTKFYYDNAQPIWFDKLTRLFIDHDWIAFHCTKHRFVCFVLSFQPCNAQWLCWKYFMVLFWFALWFWSMCIHSIVGYLSFVYKTHWQEQKWVSTNASWCKRFCKVRYSVTLFGCSRSSFFVVCHFGCLKFFVFVTLI